MRGEHLANSAERPPTSTLTSSPCELANVLVTGARKGKRERRRGEGPPQFNEWGRLGLRGSTSAPLHSQRNSTKRQLLSTANQQIDEFAR